MPPIIDTENIIDETGSALPSLQSLEPPPFDIDDAFNKVWEKSGPTSTMALGVGQDNVALRSVDDEVKGAQAWAKTKDDIAGVYQWVTRPFVSQGLNTYAALNRGAAAFYVHLDSVAQFLENRGAGAKGGFFESMAKTAEQNADYYKQRAEEVGLDFMDELISDAVGSAVPGITNFALDVASGYTFPFMSGFAQEEEAQKAEIEPEDLTDLEKLQRQYTPVAAGLLESAKTATLHHIFRMMEPLRLYLKAPATGFVFGTQAAAEAPEGERGREFAKNFVVGVGYAATSPGGKYGLREITEGIRRHAPAKGDLIPEVRPEISTRDLIHRDLTEKYGKDKADEMIELVTGIKPPRTERRALDAGGQRIPRRVDNELRAQIEDFETRAISGDKQAREQLVDAGVWKDPLPTGLLNKNGFDKMKPVIDKLPEQFFMDLDNFKDINTKFTHSGGDQVIAEVGKRLQEIIGEDDIAARPYGDEYAGGGRGLNKKLERLRTELENATIEIEVPAGTEYPKGSGTILKESLIVEQKGVRLSFGIGKTYEEAYNANEANKLARKKAGLRYEREEGPPSDFRGVGEGLAKRKQVQKSGLAEPPTDVTPGLQKRQRKFLKTIAETAELDPKLKESVEEIKPQEYTVITNKESQAAARERIKRDGLDSAREYVLSETFLDVEKSATAQELIREYNRIGDYDRATEVTESLAIQFTKAGQAVQAASQWSKLSPQGFIRWGNRQLDNIRKRYGFLDTISGRRPREFKLTPEEEAEIYRLHREANSLPDGIDKTDKTLQMIDIIAQKVPPSVSEMFDAYRYEDMLSSPKTQFRNIFENTENTFFTRPFDIVSLGAIDFIKAGLTGKERRDYISNAAVYQKSAINAIPNAINAFKETWKLGTSSTLEKPEIGIEAKNTFEQRRAKQLPPALTVVSRFMEGMDKFNMALIGAGEMARLTKQGVAPEVAYHEAQTTAQIYLYRDKLDPKDPRLSIPSKAIKALGKTIIETRHKPWIGKPVQWFVPFLATPVNKATRMIDYSLVGLIRDPRTLADREVAARALSGAIVTGLGAALTYSNDTTWSPPANPEEKKWFYNSGRKPYSIKVGDKWVPVWYTGPFALAFAFPMAVKHYYSQRPESMTDEEYQKIGGIASGVARFVGSQSSTQSIGAMFSLLNGDVDYSTINQTGFMVQQVIPASAFVRYVNTIIDPKYKHPQGFLESIEANLPILSQDVDNRLTPFLQESERDSWNYFLPYDVGKEDPTYESLYPFIQVKRRKNYLQQYAKRHGIVETNIERLINDVRQGKVTSEDSIEEFQKIIQAVPKIFEPLKGEENEE